MRRTALLGALVLLAPAVTAGLPAYADRPTSPSVSGRTATTATPERISGQVVPSDSVVDAYGVGIHTNFLDTPYRDAHAVAAAVRDLGVRHVRDDLYLDQPRQYAAIGTVAAAGAKFDLIMGRPTDSATPADYVRTVADQLPPGSVESLEGTNEWDLFSGGRSGWADQLDSWQRRLYQAAKNDPATADLPVLSPALAFRWNYSLLGNLTPWADVANSHIYPGARQPDTEISRTVGALRDAVTRGPVVVTEAGYHNAVNDKGSFAPVPEPVSGVYLPRLLLEHVHRGHQRVYSYELIDEFDDPARTNREANFGLLRHDLSPKPAYLAMKRLLGLLSDPGPAFAPSRLDASLSGLPADARYLVTQKRDGRFVLLLWRDVSVYDPDQRATVDVPPSKVTLTLPEKRQVAVYHPSTQDGPTQQATTGSLPIDLRGDVVAVTIGDRLPGAPAGVRARPRAKATTVTWRDATANGARVLSYRVSAGSRVLTVPATAYRLDALRHRVTITGLRSGKRVAVQVRARTGAGWGPAARVVVVPR